MAAVSGLAALPLRFQAKVAVGVAPSACWIWRGAVTDVGYGSFHVRDPRPRRVGAHRFAYEALLGPIAPGLQLDHLCRNSRCVNPAHLEPVTALENMRRGMSPVHIAVRRGSCLRGHPRTVENLYARRDRKGFICRPCSRIRDRERRARAAA